MAKKKLPKAQLGREMEDTIGTPAYDQIKVNREVKRMLDYLQGIPTTPREYLPKIKTPVKPNTTPGPMINPNTMEIKMAPGEAKMGRAITAMDQVQNFYKTKLTRGGKK